LVAQRGHRVRAKLKLTPLNPEVLNNVGVALMSVGDAPEAVRSYREALRLAPNYALARHNLAGALAGLGDRRSAILEYQEALRHRPKGARRGARRPDGPAGSSVTRLRRSLARGSRRTA
jgi:Flp pilus assembly protein TadD